MSCVRHTVVLSIGSNSAEKKENVGRAVKWLEGLMENTVCSDIYETPEIHGKSVTYTNAVVKGETTLDLIPITDITKEFERGNGRNSEARSKGLVPIDIDIVVWDGAILRPVDYSRSFFRIGYEQLCGEGSEF